MTRGGRGCMKRFIFMSAWELVDEKSEYCTTDGHLDGHRNAVRLTEITSLREVC